MNFYARKARAKQQSRLLVTLFIAAVVAVLIAVNLLALAVVAGVEPGRVRYLEPGWLAERLEVVVWTSIGTLAIIVLSSSFKAAMLRGGGGVIARRLGATQVERETRDPLHRRLYNVVEEMAIASGVPVPEVYVLERETAINAFAAGHSPADAAIAVTRGALETLTRAELQGVIGHEFSHILHEDVALNLRLMSLVFGLFAVAFIGRTVLRSAPRGLRGKRGGGIAVALLFALGLMIIGYVGVLVGRLIQAAISRQRELLADASAVQFTREPEGLKGALIKIGRASGGSRFRDTDAEEVAHMLFAPGVARLFATHPPLAERLRALDPALREPELRRLLQPVAPGAPPPVTEPRASHAGSVSQLAEDVPLPAHLADRIGSAGPAEIEAAQSLIAALPGDLTESLGDVSGALSVLLALVIDSDSVERARQLALITEWWGPAMRQRVEQARARQVDLAAASRLPLLETLFPRLRRLSEREATELCERLERLVVSDGKIEIFEYAIAALTRHYLARSRDASGPPGKLRLNQSTAELGIVLSTLATHGAPDFAAAEAAYGAGVRRIFSRGGPPFRPIPGWPKALEQALRCLSQLRASDKEQLLDALGATVSHDRKLTPNEAELLRVIAARLDCPLPPFVPNALG